MEAIERLESNVRSYVRHFPAVLTRARGCRIWDNQGREYLDFFAGAGSLNYGHNEPGMKAKLLEYLAGDGIAHSLDLATEAKIAFLNRLDQVIFRPRGQSWRVQFPGPTGANAVEAALKLARKVTGRTNVIHFTNAYHGVTLGTLAVTGNRTKRKAGGIPLSGATVLPYDGYLGDSLDSTELLARMLEDPSSGLDSPAAIIVETTQAEGGVNPARAEWLRRVAELAKAAGALFIVDDIQVGCGRTGTFFSFDRFGFTPDLVVLSKSIAGYGLPLSLVLIRPEYDLWAPGEHNGTFRGNNLAFITGAEALRFWETPALEQAIGARSEQAKGRLHNLAAELGLPPSKVRGRGLILGIELGPERAEAVARKAFDAGLVIETSGPRDEVLKLLPPLVITEEDLDRGLTIIEAATRSVFASRQSQAALR